MAEDKPHRLKPKSGKSRRYFDIRRFWTATAAGDFMRPGKTKGGIILTDKTVDEDRWQNKVGVVLKKGPQAFVPDEQNDFAASMRMRATGFCAARRTECPSISAAFIAALWSIPP